MSVLRVFLFGKFHVRHDQQTLPGLEARKVQELFCYLLLHRDRPHPRETLADLLWSDNSTAQSKSYLRRVLWQLQAALDSQSDPAGSRLLLVDPNWIQINPEADLWLDVAVFEQAFALVRGVPGEDLDSQSVQSLRSAVDLYRGDLLEGWYQDWCLYERERFQQMYLIMLDKLMSYYEARHDYEAGLAYGSLILRYDRARERTHQHLMRLYFLAGDRTAALRQYAQCVAALNEELGVRPVERTELLYQQIRAGQIAEPTLTPAEAQITRETTMPLLLEVLSHFRRLQTFLTDAQNEVQQGIQAIELALSNYH